jgi:hypothetical protein
MNSRPDDPSERTSDEGQVSEVSGLRDPDEAISPEDAVAGYPDSESGHPDEGPAGPDAPARRNRPIRDRKWDDD